MENNHAETQGRQRQDRIGNWPAEQVERIARAYYENNEKQKTIANRENISRQLVNKILQVARNEGIVSIYIRSSLVKPDYLSHLEQVLTSTYPQLKEARVISAFTETRNQRIQLSPDTVFTVAQAGARHVEQHFNTKSGNFNVAISPGRILSHLVSSLHPQQTYPQALMLPALGFFNIHLVRHEANILAWELAQACGGQNYFLPTEAYTSSTSPKLQTDHPPGTRHVLERLQGTDLLITGISKPLGEHADALVRKANELDLPPSRIDQLKALLGDSAFVDNVVGAIAAQYFQTDGSPVPQIDGIFGSVIGIQLENIARRVRQGKMASIGVVGGDLSRVPGIQGAIQGHYISTLVTDHLTAQALLTGETEQ